MKRGKVFVFVIVLSLILLIPSIFSAEVDHAQLGYECLESQIDSRGCGPLSVEEQAFSVLAFKKCQDELENGIDSANCWPAGSCNIKNTALSIFALAERNFDTAAAEQWLLDHTMAAQGLEWYLEIESNSPSFCTIKYDGQVFPFNINEERKLDADAGDCLVRTPEEYWYRINPSCYEKE